MFKRQGLMLELLISGDKRQWDLFVEQYANLIYSVIRKSFDCYLGNANCSEIDEVFQEVFVRLLKDEKRLLNSYDPRRSSLSTWLTIITRSVTIDYLRKYPQKNLPLEAAEQVVADCPSGAEMSVAIPEGVLSSRQRLVVELLFNRGMDTAQAAQVMGVDEQTIRSAKHKALEKLRHYYKKDNLFEK